MRVVVTVQEAATLHVLKWVPLSFGLFSAKLAKMVPILVPQGRKSEVENIRVHRGLGQDLLVGPLLLNLLDYGIWGWHHTSAWRQLALEKRLSGDRF